MIFFKIVVYKDALTKLTALITDKCYLSFLSVIALGVGGGIYIFFCFLCVFFNFFSSLRFFGFCFAKHIIVGCIYFLNSI